MSFSRLWKNNFVPDPVSFYIIFIKTPSSETIYSWKLNKPESRSSVNHCVYVYLFGSWSLIRKLPKEKKKTIKIFGQISNTVTIASVNGCRYY